MKLRNIGIALSGGGIRAAIFHLGLFQWLAEHHYFEEIKKISSVSGASLCVGLIYAHNNLNWPTSKEFLTTVLPAITKTLTTTNLQYEALTKLVVSPKYWNKKVNMIARALESKWGVHGTLSQLTGDVIWYSNCTTYETGKRFQFCQYNMGDYIIGYVQKPDIAIADVMAASAGFPALIGPYSLKTGAYQWNPSQYAAADWNPPGAQTLHLWDGGVYDNMGLESIFKIGEGGSLSDGVDFMIVSNASASIERRVRKCGLALSNMKRLLDISMDQVAALHSRTVMDFIKRTEQGMFIKIGNSADKITTESGCSQELKTKLLKQCLSSKQAKKAMHYPTTLAKPAKADYQLLLRHGYEVANCTYLCYTK